METWTVPTHVGRLLDSARECRSPRHAIRIAGQKCSGVNMSSNAPLTNMPTIFDESLSHNVPERIKHKQEGRGAALSRIE